MKDKRTYFRYFSRGERRALLLMLCFSCFAFLFPTAWLPLPESDRIAESDREWLEAQYRDWKAAQEKKIQRRSSGEGMSRLSMRRFDPNHTNVRQLLEMGASPRLARNWAKYLEKGGRFKSVGDVKKLYGMEPGYFEKIRPWMYVAEQRDTFPSVPRPFLRKKEGCLKLDINIADSVGWERLPGIGPVLAGRIVRFRNRLGGFYSIKQVGETYGLPDSTFQRILPCLELATPFVQFDVNTAGEAELRSHPYIGYKLARMLIAFREQNGPFTSSNDLFKLPLMDTLTFQRLKPYLRQQ
jgi:competence protein ComEA